MTDHTTADTRRSLKARTNLGPVPSVDLNRLVRLRRAAGRCWWLTFIVTQLGWWFDSGGLVHGLGLFVWLATTGACLALALAEKKLRESNSPAQTSRAGDSKQ
jgi:hypothetical protein